MAKYTKDQLIAQASAIGLSEGRDLASMTNQQLIDLIDATQKATGDSVPPVAAQASTDAPVVSSDAPVAEVEPSPSADQPDAEALDLPVPSADPEVETVEEQPQPGVVNPEKTIESVIDDAFPPAVDPAIEAQRLADEELKEKTRLELEETQKKLVATQALLQEAQSKVDVMLGKNREERLKGLKEKLDAHVRNVYRLTTFDCMELLSLI